jgi:hypothetical protein
MRPVTYIYDDLGALDNAAGMVPLYLRDLVVMTPETGFDDEPIVLDAMPSTDHGDDFMDRIIAMLTDVPVVFTMSALIGERTDIESALAEPLSRATLALTRLRREHGAFDGDYDWDSDDNGLIVNWSTAEHLVRLHVPDPREGTDFILVAKSPDGDQEWRSLADLAAPAENID